MSLSNSLECRWTLARCSNYTGGSTFPAVATSVRWLNGQSPGSASMTEFRFRCWDMSLSLLANAGPWKTGSSASWQSIPTRTLTFSRRMSWLGTWKAQA